MYKLILKTDTWYLSKIISENIDQDKAKKNCFQFGAILSG
jgi:hypothetical protein